MRLRSKGKFGCQAPAVPGLLPELSTGATYVHQNDHPRCANRFEACVAGGNVSQNFPVHFVPPLVLRLLEVAPHGARGARMALRGRGEGGGGGNPTIP